MKPFCDTDIFPYALKTLENLWHYSLSDTFSVDIKETRGMKWVNST